MHNHPDPSNADADFPADTEGMQYTIGVEWVHHSNKVLQHIMQCVVQFNFESDTVPTVAAHKITIQTKCGEDLDSMSVKE